MKSNPTLRISIMDLHSNRKQLNIHKRAAKLRAMQPKAKKEKCDER